MEINGNLLLIYASFNVANTMTNFKREEEKES
jgi:hypothetical protein